MTNFKRFSAAVAATLMAACMVAPMAMTNVSAADGTCSITINDDGYTHSDVKAYQIFAGSATAEGLNITGWGDGINAQAFVEALQNDDTFEVDGVNVFDAVTVGEGEAYTDATVAVAVANIIDGFDNKSVKAEAVARLAIANKATASGNYDANVISGIATGYYVVVDEEAATNADETAETYSLGMLKVVDTAIVDVDTKIDYPTFTKEINDINDSTETAYVKNETTGILEGGTWGTDADHDMGDDVYFKLTATLPSNYDDYTSYKLVFHDDLQKTVFALDTSSFVVYLDDGATKTKIESGYTVSTTTAADANFTNGKTDGTKDFTITFDDVKAIAAAGAGESIVVEYKATLTDDAKIGDDGNWNSAYLSYSNNPNYTGAGANSPTADTPEETVVAFTYQVNVDKIDGATDKALEGAGFTLYKWNAASTEEDKYEAVGSEITGVTTFEFKGLDDGKYKLVETTVPQYYNKADDVEFTITAGHASKSLTSLSGGDLGTGIVDTGLIETDVENNKGSSLPSTGGIGTTLFYLGGGAMVAVAGVYLISKKRMNNADAE